MAVVKSVWKLFQKLENLVYVKFHIKIEKILYPMKDVLYANVMGILFWFLRCNPADVHNHHNKRKNSVDNSDY